MSKPTRDSIPPDPLIDEVRAIRKAISDRFDNDVDRLCDYLVEQQKNYAERLVPDRIQRPRNAKS